MILSLQSKSQGNNVLKPRSTARITLKETAVFPPLHEVDVIGLFTGELERGPWIIDSSGLPKSQVCIANALVIPRNGTVPVRLMNPSSLQGTLHCGDTLSTMELLNNSEGITIGCLSTEESTSSDSKVTPEKKSRLHVEPGPEDEFTTHF